MTNYDALIVADYDGTMNIHGEIKELEKIRQLLYRIKQNSNLFMLSTGRLFQSISNDISLYNILFDYLACANGNLVFDDKYNLLFSQHVKPEILSQLKPYYKYIMAIDALDEYGQKTCDNPIEYFIHIDKNVEVRRTIVNFFQNSKLVDYCTDGVNKFDIHVFNLSSKLVTIEFIRKQLSMSCDKIYTIGNGPNDLEMIIKYNGYIVGNDIYVNDKNLNNILRYDSFLSALINIDAKLIRRKD